MVSIVAFFPGINQVVIIVTRTHSLFVENTIILHTNNKHTLYMVALTPT